MAGEVAKFHQARVLQTDGNLHCVLHPWDVCVCLPANAHGSMQVAHTLLHLSRLESNSTNSSNELMVPMDLAETNQTMVSSKSVLVPQVLPGICLRGG